jgi:hypothetical protein
MELKIDYKYEMSMLKSLSLNEMTNSEQQVTNKK